MMVRFCSESEFTFNTPRVFKHIIKVQILVVVVPADDVEIVVVVEHVVGERADLGQVRVTLHQIGLHVELEALLRSLCFVKATKNQNVF